MLAMSYSLAPDALVPNLDDVARIRIFEHIHELHQEREQEERLSAMRQDLQAQYGTGRR